MSSQTQRDQESTATPEPRLPAASAQPAEASADADDGERVRPHRRWPVVVLSLALVLAIGGGVYLGLLSRAWADRAEEVDGVARELGAELAETRSQVEETQGTLGLVESQLDVAQEQIHELADTAAQFGDDREIQRQVAEYQSELFAAATGVTGTMSECISTQTEYTLALEDELVRLAELLRTPPEDEATEDPSPEPTDEPTTEPPPDLGAMRQGVVGTCQEASDAQESLQQRLGDS